MLLCIEIVKGYGANHTLLWRTRETTSVKRSYLCDFVSQKFESILLPLYYTRFSGKVYWKMDDG